MKRKYNQCSERTKWNNSVERFFIWDNKDCKYAKMDCDPRWIIEKNTCKIDLEPWSAPHSSVDSSAPTILPAWVRVPSTPSTLYHCKSNLCYIFLGKRTKINKNEAGFSPFLTKSWVASFFHLESVVKFWRFFLQQTASRSIPFPLERALD